MCIVIAIYSSQVSPHLPTAPPPILCLKKKPIKYNYVVYIIYILLSVGPSIGA